MPSLSTYQHDLEYSYAPGIFPSMEALLHAPESVTRLLVDSKSTQKEGVQKLMELAQTHNVRIEQADKVLAKISGKDNCFASAVFLKNEQALNRDTNHIVLHNPSDFGNLGTILRTALGMGYQDIAIVTPAADVFDPRVVRASMGAMFSMRIERFESFNVYFEKYQNHTFFPFMLDSSVPLKQGVQQKKEPFSLIFGNEGKGLPKEFAQLGTPVRIEHNTQIDSLNLSIAASIGMYAFNQTKGE